jgi:hypothetical protein
MNMAQETDRLIRLVDELVVARNQRIRAEHHVTVLRELENQAAEKVEHQREKMALGDATMAACRV